MTAAVRWEALPTPAGMCGSCPGDVSLGTPQGSPKGSDPSGPSSQLPQRNPGPLPPRSPPPGALSGWVWLCVLITQFPQEERVPRCRATVASPWTPPRKPSPLVTAVYSRVRVLAALFARMSFGFVWAVGAPTSQSLPPAVLARHVSWRPATSLHVNEPVHCICRLRHPGGTGLRKPSPHCPAQELSQGAPAACHAQGGPGALHARVPSTHRACK